MTQSIHFPVTTDQAIRLRGHLDADGHAVLPGLLSASQCAKIAGLWEVEGSFRKRVVMEKHRFGQGEYRYFNAPLPPLVQALRESFYQQLAPLARDWAARLDQDEGFPPTLEEFQRRCAEAGQDRPTPLLLRYRSGDYNRLHQDLYGGVVFPLQLVVLLSRPGADFQGGEFVLVEQQARLQSRPRVVVLQQGDGLVFPVHHRPVAGRRGTVRATMRHGVSTVHSGERLALGVIFHDAD